jgi:dCMP deaminase
MLKLDDQFSEDYFKYYGKTSPYEAVAAVNHDIQKYSGYTVVNALNLIKTCATLSNSYMECCMELANRNNSAVSDKDPGRSMFNLVFFYLYEAIPAELESFLGIRFTVRDIYAEIAKEAYGKSDPETIEKVKAIKTEHTYSIQDPNPVSRDQWFYNMAVAVGAYAKCHSRKIGAVLVRDKSVISTGYNGPPRGVPTCDPRWVIDKAFKEKYGHHMLDTEHDDIEFKTTKGFCPRRIIGFPSGEGLEVCPAGHAERNALINAAKLGIKTNHTKLYMSCGVPCTPCMVEIINSGVDELVCTSMHIYDETAMYLLENCDVKVRIFDFLV